MIFVCVSVCVSLCAGDDILSVYTSPLLADLIEGALKQVCVSYSFFSESLRCYKPDLRLKAAVFP